MYPADWETALTRHYLRTDGPHGSGSLRFIDASPEELARAIGAPVEQSDAVLQKFVQSLGNAPAVREVLTYGHMPVLPTAEGPGWFSYLFVTCLVAAASEELVAEGDFRDRMRQLFGWRAPIMHLQGIPILWEALKNWCERKRRVGEPYRKIILPNRGNMHQIGETVRIAFPSRLRRFIDVDDQPQCRLPILLLASRSLSCLHDVVLLRQISFKQSSSQMAPFSSRLSDAPPVFLGTFWLRWCNRAIEKARLLLKQ